MTITVLLFTFNTGSRFLKEKIIKDKISETQSCFIFSVKQENTIRVKMIISCINVQTTWKCVLKLGDGTVKNQKLYV